MGRVMARASRRVKRIFSVFFIFFDHGLRHRPQRLVRIPKTLAQAVARGRCLHGMMVQEILNRVHEIEALMDEGVHRASNLTGCFPHPRL